MYLNNMQKKLELKQRKEDAGLVSERFPQVQSLKITMTYYKKRPNPVLMLRTLNILPDSPAYFHMRCKVKECCDGGFDLMPEIRKMVRARKLKASGSIACKGKGDNLDPDHASVEYEINAKYKKAAKKKK